MRFLPVLLLLFLLAPLAAHSSDSATKTAQMSSEVKTILKKANDAINAHALKDIKSMTQQVTMTIANMGITGTIKATMKAEKVRLESQMAGVNETSGFDGKVAWKQSLTMGLRILEGAEKLNKISTTLPYALAPEKFYDKIELEGKELFNKVECFKVKFSKEGMEPVYQFYNTKSFISQGEVRTIPSPMGKIPTKTVYSQYKTHKNGFKYPVTMIAQAGPMQMDMKMTSIEVNATVDDKVFTVPNE